MLSWSILQYFWPALSNNRHWKPIFNLIFEWPLKTCFTVHLSRDIWFPTMWHFDKCSLRLAWTAFSYALKLQLMFGQKLNSHIIFKRLATVRHWSDCAYAQAGLSLCARNLCAALSLCWPHTPHCSKSHVVAPFLFSIVHVMLMRPAAVEIFSPPTLINTKSYMRAHALLTLLNELRKTTSDQVLRCSVTLVWVFSPTCKTLLKS